jgi:threonine/homoserine/homoserine lactone efflux protein
VDLSAAGLPERAILASLTPIALAAIDLTWTFLAHKARLLLRTPRSTRITHRISAVALGGATAVA